MRITRRPLRRPVNLLVVTMLVLAIVAPFGAAQAACGNQEGPWRSIEGPKFPQGSQTITSFAVDPQVPKRMFVSNGAVLMRSENDGCAWKPAFSVADESTFQKPLTGGAVIKNIAIPERGGARMYLLIEEQVGPASAPHVMVGTNGGDDWRLGDVGLPPVGTPGRLSVAPNDPAYLYLTVDAAGASDLLFVSTNGADAWQPRGRLPTTLIGDVEIDPVAKADIWVSGSTGLFHSTDSGSTFTEVDDFTGQVVGVVDVFHSGAAPARVIAFGQQTKMSRDGGQQWLDIGSPGPPNSAAHLNTADEVAIATAASVYAWAPTILNWVDLYPPRSGVKGLQADRTGARNLYGFTARTIEIFSGDLGVKVKIPDDTVEIPDVSLIDTLPPDLGLQTELTPTTSNVRIDPGKSKTVTYKLDVPRTLTPLDVDFVVDTSSSMTQVIKEAAEALEEIHNGLARSGAAVEFGLSEYRSYPTDVPPRPDTDNYVYQRVLDIGASADDMETAIAGLAAEGGGIFDAQLEALWQTVTGEGKDVWPPGPSSRDVAPGLQSNFRAKALRVVLHVGDEPFGDEDSASDNDNNVTRPESRVARPDIPEFDAVAAAFRANGIKQLGLSLYPDATPDLRKMAKATNALAPRGGVDCDRDGRIDVQAGAPLVCVLQQDEIDDANMAPAIIELVEAIRTKSELNMTASSDRPVVEKITPDRYDRVILQADNSLEFDVTYHCSRTLAGKTTDVELTVHGVRGSEPTATARVFCGSVEEESQLPPPPPQLFLLAPLVAIAPPPPPINVTSSATQAQAQAQANAAFAAQEQEQPQMAFAHQFKSELTLAQEEEYSFSTLRKEQGPPLALWGAAALMSGAFSVAMSTRTRLRLRYARRR